MSRAARCASPACRPARPARSLDDPERPTLRFAEDACVQCGLCQATCPEKVITLTPQLDFRAATAPARVLKQEEPFRCIRCDKPFGVKSTIERVGREARRPALDVPGQASALDILRMCDDCRVIAVTEAGFRSLRRPAAPAPAHHRGLSARARGTRAQGRGVALDRCADRTVGKAGAGPARIAER